MLTRRENLLIRPWQERRYINHRIKVETALPVIDNTPPPLRQHVAYKMKKFQKERERCTQIVSDNFTLLQHLDYIRRTTRVNHVWDEPPPNFLNRVGIYSYRRHIASETDESQETFEEPKTRKDRCYGCSPHRYPIKAKIPEERIPFAPPKKKVSRKLRSPPDEESPKQMMDRKEDTESTTDKAAEFMGKSETAERRTRGGRARTSAPGRRSRRVLQQQTQSVLVSRGPLTFRVSFPADTGLVFNDKGRSRVLSRQTCHCAAGYSRKAPTNNLESRRSLGSSA